MDKKTIRFVNFVAACLLLVCCSWQILRAILYGENQPSLVVGLVFLFYGVTGLYAHYIGWKDRKAQKIQDQKDIQNQIE